MNVETARLKSILGQLPAPQTALELGCGDCPDVLRYFATRSAGLLLGVDWDGQALYIARVPTIALLQADITRLPLRTRFDLIAARHPDVDRRTAAWQIALTHASELLRSDGILLVTVYSLPEMEIVDGWMKSTGLACLPIAAGKLTPPGLQGRDRFVGAWRNLSGRSNV